MGNGGSRPGPSATAYPGLPVIYEDPVGGGSWMKLQAGSYPKMSSIPKVSVPEQNGLAQGTGGPNTYLFGKVGSMNIPPGVTVELYSGPAFNGTKWTYVGPLVATYIGDAAYNSPNNSSNFSIKVLGGPLTNLTGTTVSGTLKQTQPYSQYRNGDCECCSSNDGCPYGDWVISHTKCGKCCVQSQPVCSVLNSALCPVIGKGASSITWAVPNGIGDAASAQVKCAYDLAQFQTGNDITNFLNGNPLNPWQDQANVNKEYNETIMPYFCGQQVSTCPIDSTTGKPMPKCSRFVSTANDGSAAVCTEWITKGLAQQSGFDSSVADATMKNYCTKYNTPDCNCINRANDPDYKLIAPTQTGNAGCWWNACRNPSVSLVPSTENSTTVYSRQPCPSSCKVDITNVASNFSVINIGQLQSKINCTFIQPPSGPTGPTGSTGPSTPGGPTGATGPSAPGGPTGPTGPGSTTPSGPTGPTQPPVTPVPPAKKGISPFVWAGVGIGVLLLIIVIIVAIVIFTRKKPTIPPGATLV